MIYEKVCECCGEVFTVKKLSKFNIRRFCSKKCANTRNGRHIARANNYILVRCAHCDKEEYVCKSRAEKYKCCSVNCLSAYNKYRMLRGVTLECPYCKKTFITRPSHAHKRVTCGDKKCLSEHLAKRTGISNSNFRHGKSVGKGKRKKRDLSYVALVKDYIGIERLPPYVAIHHRDGDTTNNNLSNLMLANTPNHSWLHAEAGKILLKMVSEGVVSLDMALKYSSDTYRFLPLMTTSILDQAVVLKSGEFSETPAVDNTEPSSSNELSVEEKVQRIVGEDSTNNPTTSARHINCEDVC